MHLSHHMPKRGGVKKFHVRRLLPYTNELEPIVMFPSEHKLGDTVDDFCVKCKRLTNHNIVSLLATDPAKVRCCTCYSDHDFLNEIAPPPKPRKVVG